MIISASRRTDIPAYYSDWFFNRIREGFVYVQNPMNPRQISKIDLSPDVVDGIVFWTKNPLPMMNRLDLLNRYAYYVQFTVTPYGQDIETRIPDKDGVMIPAFQQLSRLIGPERVIWRYDPILLTSAYTIDYHETAFEKMAERLAGYTEKCVISFIDLYRSTLSNTKHLRLLPLGTPEMLRLAERFARIAEKYHLALESCAEEIDLEQFGISHGRCIDGELFERLLGCRLTLEKDKNQRKECGCMAGIDIGMYDTCLNGCCYCYANHSGKRLLQNQKLHNPCSPLMAGEAQPEDVVRVREMKSLRDGQMCFSFK